MIVLNKILEHLELRNDSSGYGHFGASRGSRKHQGVDYIVTKNQRVLAPEKMKFIRLSKPYANDLKWYGGLFKGLETGIEYKIFYMIPDVENISFERGETIGFAQDISEKWGGTMKPHIHLEMRKENELLNPEDYLKNSVSSKKK